MQFKDDIFTGTVNNCKRFQETVKKAAEESEDVKNGECKLEEKLKEPGCILYDRIADSIIRILSDEIILNHIQNIINMFPFIPKEEKMNIMKSFIELFTVIITNSSFNAIICYDELLKDELKQQFDHMVEGINLTRADVEGQHMAIDVLRKKIDEISSKLKISEIKNSIN